MLRLIFPSIKYKNFVKAVHEYFNAKEIREKETFELLNKIKDKKIFYSNKNKKLKELIPSSHYWLVDDTDYIIRINIRHKLNKKLQKSGGHIEYALRPSKRRLGYGKNILRLELLKAKGLGINNVLITCNKNDTGSRKIIEANGANFINEIKIKGQKIPVLRFKIQK